jgi:hypothetical protein
LTALSGLERSMPFIGLVGHSRVCVIFSSWYLER